MKFFLQSIVLLFCTFSVAQSSLIDRLHTMQKNPRLKEKVYVHTNKTAYFTDDIIWFKAYVGDSINRPSIETRILEVELFDRKGTRLFDRSIPIETGTGNGQIELNDAVAPGTYYLQARTNYMRNFGEEYRHLQEITVLGERLPSTSVETDKKYDVQLFPESGNLIEDIVNTLGIKAMLNGQSVDFRGTIVNQKDETVTTFQSEHRGMGRCSFGYKKGETYRAKLKFRDTLIEKNVPTALMKGVSLSIDNTDDENLRVYLKTNEATFYDQVYSNYSLLYHQDRQLFQLVSVARLDSINGLLETNKNIFLDGVHTVTLFADDRPIAERKFYIERARKKSFVSLEKSKTEHDSVTYRLRSKGQKENLTVDLSVSVLLKDSEAAGLENTIESDFLLTPYVKGHVESPAYYFNEENERRKEHLDLLLLTQGWTGYTLNEIIEHISPVENYSFETGFELKGTVKDGIKHKKLVLIPDNFDIIDKVNLRGGPEFVFQNLNVFKGDTVRVAYQNWLGKIIKPSKIEYDTVRHENISKLNIPKALKISSVGETAANQFDRTTKNGAAVTGTDTQVRSLDGTIDLDEVIVTERKRSEQYIQRRKLIEKYEPLVFDIGKYYNLPIPEYSTKQDLMSFLRFNEGIRLINFDGKEIYLEGADRKRAFLYIDGRSIESQELVSIPFKMEDIENIMISPNLKKFMLERGTFIQVFTKDLYRNNTPPLFNKHVIEDGFDRPKKYYSPLYDSNKKQFSNWLEIDWKPVVKTDKNGVAFIKVPKIGNQQQYLFSIQGFSEKGHLISDLIVE